MLVCWHSGLAGFDQHLYPGFEILTIITIGSTTNQVAIDNAWLVDEDAAATVNETVLKPLIHGAKGIIVAHVPLPVDAGLISGIPLCPSSPARAKTELIHSSGYRFTGRLVCSEESFNPEYVTTSLFSVSVEMVIEGSVFSGYQIASGT